MVGVEVQLAGAGEVGIGQTRKEGLRAKGRIGAFILGC